MEIPHVRPLPGGHRPHRRGARAGRPTLGASLVHVARGDPDERAVAASVPGRQFRPAVAGGGEPTATTSTAGSPTARRSELGAQVRRGAHGTTVVFWQLRRVAATAEAYPRGGRSTVTARQGLPAAARLHGVQRRPGRRPAGDVHRRGQDELGARGEGRGAAADVRRHRAPRRHQGVLQPRRRRDPAAAPRGVRRSGRLLQRRHCTSSPTGPGTRAAATGCWPAASAMPPTPRRS